MKTTYFYCHVQQAAILISQYYFWPVFKQENVFGIFSLTLANNLIKSRFNTSCAVQKCVNSKLRQRLLSFKSFYLTKSLNLSSQRTIHFVAYAIFRKTKESVFVNDCLKKKKKRASVSSHWV